MSVRSLLFPTPSFPCPVILEWTPGHPPRCNTLSPESSGDSGSRQWQDGPFPSESSFPFVFTKQRTGVRMTCWCSHQQLSRTAPAALSGTPCPPGTQEPQPTMSQPSSPFCYSSRHTPRQLSPHRANQLWLTASNKFLQHEEGPVEGWGRAFLTPLFLRCPFFLWMKAGATSLHVVPWDPIKST